MAQQVIFDSFAGVCKPWSTSHLFSRDGFLGSWLSVQGALCCFSVAGTPVSLHCSGMCSAHSVSGCFPQGLETLCSCASLGLPAPQTKDFSPQKEPSFLKHSSDLCLGWKCPAMVIFIFWITAHETHSVSLGEGGSCFCKPFIITLLRRLLCFPYFPF